MASTSGKCRSQTIEKENDEMNVRAHRVILIEADRTREGDRKKSKKKTLKKILLRFEIDSQREIQFSDKQNDNWLLFISHFLNIFQFDK